MYPGVHDLAYSHPHATGDTTVTSIIIVENETQIFDITLQLMGGIAGIVYDNETSIPLQGAVIELNIGLIDTTDEAGAYSFVSLENGTYDISFSCEQYEDTTVTGVAVVYDSIAQVTVGMIPHLGVDDKKANIPDEFSLMQNYPNPFNNATSICYNLPQDCHVSLKVYDLLGRCIGAIVDEPQQTGYHQAVWNAGGVSSGIYFYRLQAGEYSEAKKMLLLK